MSQLELDEFREEARTVSDYTRELKRLLEGQVAPCWIRGEISNYRRQASGHQYFSLKDDRAQLPAVMFKGDGRSLRFVPQNGREVLAYGEISLYEPYGRYQLIVRAMTEGGVGRLHREFERLKAKLNEEGLFDAARKKPLPFLIRRVAFVTSPTGAALQDFIRILGRRKWGGTLVVVPVKVQGVGSAAEIVGGIEAADRMGSFDLIVVGRGGGSLEDLWSFNEESLARAIANAKTPIASAVGHEIDFSLADFAADIRAETPSAAAELISSAWLACGERLMASARALALTVTREMKAKRERLGYVSLRFRAASPVSAIQTASIKLDELERRLRSAGIALLREKRAASQAGIVALDRVRIDAQLLAARHRYETIRGKYESGATKQFESIKRRFEKTSSKFESLSPMRALSRGYAILSKPDGTTIRSVREIKNGERVRATLVDGDARLRAEP